MNRSTIAAKVRREKRPASGQRREGVPPVAHRAVEETGRFRFDSVFGQMLDLVEPGHGPILEDYQREVIQGRILHRMAFHRIRRPADYLRLLRQQASEAQVLRNDILSAGPGFFSEPATDDYFKNSLFPEWWQQRPAGEPLRCWVPGCGSGEETYSLAICLLECLGPKRAGHPIRIYGTDASHRAIKAARAGWYPETITKSVSPERLRRFFVKTTHGYQVTGTVRDLVAFGLHDFFLQPPLANLDLVNSRNLYKGLKPRAGEGLSPVFHFALKPTGLLILGGSETTGNFAGQFSLLHKEHRIYAKKSIHDRRFVMSSTKEASSERPVPGPATADPDAGPPGPSDPNKKADRIGASRAAIPAQLIDQLRAAKEELVLAEEEVQAGYEELKATRQALDEAHEQLKSTCREAASTDDLLRQSNIELNDVNSDFEGLLGGVNLPLILVGTDLRLRRMTPLAQKLLGLALPDIGRKIGDLHLAIFLPDLATIVTEVLQTRRAIQREVQDRAGRWYSLGVRPCQSTGDSIHGAVLTLMDIDTLKRSEDELNAAHGLTQTVVDRVPDPLVVLNSDLRVQAVNQAYGQQFHVPVPDMTGAPLFGPRKGQWTSLRVRSWLEETLCHDQPEGPFEIEDDFPQVGRKRMALNARKLPGHSRGPGRILLIVREICAGGPATKSPDRNSAAPVACARSST